MGVVQRIGICGVAALLLVAMILVDRVAFSSRGLASTGCTFLAVLAGMRILRSAYRRSGRRQLGSSVVPGKAAAPAGANRAAAPALGCGGGEVGAASAAGDGCGDDPFRWSFVPSKGTNLTDQVVEEETDLCHLRMYVMGRPVHDPERDAREDYPSSWHFAQRSRKWEMRLQFRFKRLPEGPLFLGFEYTTYQRLSPLVRHAEAALVASVSKIMGPVYKSPGDDPARTGGAEAEPPCAAVPLYAFDQLIVSEIGSEPDVSSSLDGLGWLRADGLAAFQSQIEATMGAPSTDKVYTLCVWSVSRIIDMINWTVGVPGGPRLHSTRLTGAPPLIATVYELADPEGASQHETRHLISRKRYYTRFAFWSMVSPPEPEHLRRVLQVKDDARQLNTQASPESAYKLGWFWEWAEAYLSPCLCRSPHLIG